MDQEQKEKQQAQEEIADREMLSQFANSQGWKLAKESLIRKVIALDSLSATVEEMQKKRLPIDEIKETLCINAKAVNIIVEWLNEIQTTAGGQGTFAKEIEEKKSDQIIVTIPQN